MTDLSSLFKALELPKQDIDLLAFCVSNKAAKVSDWVDNLKTTQTLATAAQLYQATPQVLRLKVPASERKLMLDSLFLVAYPCALSLGREFLNQPLALPENAQKAAVLGQAILKGLVTGYLLVLEPICDEKKRKQAQQTIAAQCLFNSLQCLALMQLRNQQLYSQASPLIWRLANSLYLIAEQLELQYEIVKPQFSGLQPATISQVYLRIIAQASAKLNQMTQIDMGHVFNALENWAKVIKVTQEPATFWIDLDTTQGPTFSEKREPPTEGNIRHFDFSALTQQLSGLLEGDMTIVGNAISISIPPELSTPTTLHLEGAWGKHSSRSSNRKTSQQTAEVVVGFQQCHSKLSGVEDFGEFLGSEKKAKSKGSGLSSLLGSLTPGDTKSKPQANTLTPLRVTTQNISKTGYCLLWEGTQPVRIDAGDVIAIREHAKRDWGLGVIRWIRKLKNHSLLGVQLLATKPQPVAAACNYDDGGFSDFMRAFLLPSQHPKGPADLLTANVLFDEHTRVKVKLDSDSKASEAKLGECQLSTGKVRAFSLIQSAASESISEEDKHKL